MVVFVLLAVSVLIALFYLFSGVGGLGFPGILVPQRRLSCVAIPRCWSGVVFCFGRCCLGGGWFVRFGGFVCCFFVARSGRWGRLVLRFPFCDGVLFLRWFGRVFIRRWFPRCDLCLLGCLFCVFLLELRDICFSSALFGLECIS